MPATKRRFPPICSRPCSYSRKATRGFRPPPLVGRSAGFPAAMKNLCDKRMNGCCSRESKTLNELPRCTFRFAIEEEAAMIAPFAALEKCWGVAGQWSKKAARYRWGNVDGSFWLDRLSLQMWKPNCESMHVSSAKPFSW